MTLALEDTEVYDFFTEPIESGPVAELPCIASQVYFDCWEASDFTNSEIGHEVVLSLTAEAVRPNPPRDFLQTTIGRLLIKTDVKPTYEFVVPTVVSLLDDVTAAKYLEVMLGENLGGWLPFQSERGLLLNWIDRFQQPLLNTKLRAQLVELDAATARANIARLIQDYEDRELKAINQLIADRSAHK